MSARVWFSGLEEFKADLRKLPRELADKGAYIIRHRAVEAMTEIDAKYQNLKYPARSTGNLRKGLQITEEPSTFGMKVVLRNTAKHAFIYENGTETRETAAGWDRGKMPPARVFVPTAQKHRRLMYQELAQMMRDAGLRVTGAFGMSLAA